VIDPGLHRGQSKTLTDKPAVKAIIAGLLRDVICQNTRPGVTMQIHGAYQRFTHIADSGKWQ
jgi:poly(3-hydroxybutyrate) depolymerase